MEGLHIPHPGRVVGRLVMLLTMPGVLNWVLGGNVAKTDGSRTSSCRLGDKPKAFGEPEFATFMGDDEAIVRSSHADWLLVSERDSAGAEAAASGADACSTSQVKGIYIRDAPTTVGRASPSPSSSLIGLVVDDMHAAEQHARVWRDPSGQHLLKDMGSRAGTWVNGRQLASGASVQLWPGDLVEFGRHPSLEVFKVKMQHVTLRNDDLQGHQYNTLVVGKPREPLEPLPEQQKEQPAGRQGQGSLVAV